MSYFGKPRIFGEPLGLLLMRGAAGGLAEFSDDFATLQAGWSGNLSVSGGQAIVTPTLGAELLTNGAAPITFTADDPDSWDVISESVGVNGEITERDPGQANGDTATVGGAMNCYYLTTALRLRQTALTAGEWIHLNADYVLNAGTLWLRAPDGNNDNQTDILVGTENNFALLSVGTLFEIAGRNVTADITFESISAKAVSDFAGVRDVGFVQGSVQTTPTVNGRAGAGIIHYVDDNNYVLAFVRRSLGAFRYGLVKRVSGTVTYLGSGITNGGTITLTRSGNDYSMQIAESTVVTATAVNDAVFTTNTVWGMFSTYAGNRFDDFVAQEVA